MKTKIRLTLALVMILVAGVLAVQAADPEIDVNQGKDSA